MIAARAASRSAPASSVCAPAGAATSVQTASIAAASLTVGEFTLRNQDDGSAPERDLLPHRIEHTDLAVVAARRHLAERPREPERHGFRVCLEAVDARGRRPFEDPHAVAMERQARHQRLLRRALAL